MVNFKQGISLVYFGIFSVFSKDFVGSGVSERKSLVNLRFFLGKNKKNQGMEGQGGGLFPQYSGVSPFTVRSAPVWQQDLALLCPGGAPRQHPPTRRMVIGH